MSEVVDFFNDALTVGTMGIVDAKKGRFYVPFSGASARAGARAIAGSSADIFYGVQGKSAKNARKIINTDIDSPIGRIAGTAAAIASGVATGAAAGPAAAGAGGAIASSIAQADALNQQMPELKVQKPLGNESTAVQRAVAEAASRRSRSRSARSTILSKNFLNPTNPGLKEYFGS